MPERTADVRRLVKLVHGLQQDQPRVAVVGHPGVWRDDLAELLTERLPGAQVTAYDDLPAVGPGLVVALELDASEAELQTAMREWESSGRRARGEPLLPGARWTVGAGGAVPEREPPPAGDVAFVPVSGVRPPRRVRLFWDYSTAVLWDDGNAYLGELEDLLPMPGELRTRLKDWAARVDAADGAERRGERRRLARELQVALGPDFRVET